MAETTLEEKVAAFIVNPDIPQEIRALVEQQLGSVESDETEE